MSAPTVEIEPKCAQKAIFNNLLLCW